MKLTIDIFQEPETPGVWISHCVELDVVSQHPLPEVAIEAVAEAVRLTLQHEMKQRGVSCAEAFAASAKEVAQRRLAASSAHDRLDINGIERACREWKVQLGQVCDDERIHLDGGAMLSLAAIARAAKAVRDARRGGLRGDYDQDVHDDLARALDEAGLGDEREMQRRPR